MSLRNRRSDLSEDRLRMEKEVNSKLEQQTARLWSLNSRIPKIETGRRQLFVTSKD